MSAENDGDGKLIIATLFDDDGEPYIKLSDVMIWFRKYRNHLEEHDDIGIEVIEHSIDCFKQIGTALRQRV
jgi:hypothetical protein